MDIQGVADEVFAVLGTGRQIAPFSARWPDFGLEDAYKVAAAVRARREARGERPIGRKIGFTNRTIWAEYNVYAPMWDYVYDTTVRELRKEGTDASSEQSNNAPTIEGSDSHEAKELCSSRNALSSKRTNMAWSCSRSPPESISNGTCLSILRFGRAFRMKPG